MSPWLWHLLHPIVMLLIRLRVGVKLKDGGSPPPEGPVLICAKHGSALDIPLLADLAWKRRRRIVRFQMGSFIGYPLLGPLVPILKRLGGFTVMRPKEVLRLRKRKGWDRARIRATMERINQEAEDERRAVLEAGEGLVVFPEGTRDASAVRPLVAELELQTAVKLASEGREIWVWPMVPCYGNPRFPGRRGVVLETLPAFPVGNSSAEELLGKLQGIFEAHWRSPAEVDGNPAEGGATMQSMEEVPS